MAKKAAQLAREIAESLRSVDAKKLFAWIPKLKETLVDIDEGRLSHSPGEPVLVSRLDTPRGAYFVLDGHHRMVEAILAKKNMIPIQIDAYVPRIEHIGGAYNSYVENKVNVVDFLQSYATRSGDVSRGASAKSPRQSPRHATKKIAKDIEAAVRAAQLYIGKGLTMRITDEQKLYSSMNRKIASVAKRRNMDEAVAYQQIMGEAKRRGGIQAIPGKDI